MSNNFEEMIERMCPADQERARYLKRDFSIWDKHQAISSFLDMGAGSGSMSCVAALLCPEAQGSLVDVKERLTINAFADESIASRLQGYDWPAENELSGKHFDLVLCMDVLEHIPKWRSALHNLFQYVKPGGCLYVQTPSRYPSPNWPTTGILKNAFKGLFGRHNPASHVRHGLSCKEILDECLSEFEPIVAAEDYVVDGMVSCSFKPRTHLLLLKRH